MAAAEAAPYPRRARINGRRREEKPTDNSGVGRYWQRGRLLLSLAVGLGFLLWFAGWGWAIDFLWQKSGIPEHSSWGQFYSVWIPLSWFLFTVISVLFSLCESPSALGSVARQGFASLALLIFLLMEAGWRELAPWGFWFGVFFVASILVRGAIFLLPLWRNRPLCLPSKVASVRIFVGSLLVYGLLAPWIVRTLPTAGDEPHYLLITHSILVDRDLDLRNNYENEDYRPFHWGRLSPQGPGSVSAHGIGFPLLVLPGYALAGRLGATWVVAILGALLSMNVYWFCLDLSLSQKASLQAWALSMFTIPISTYANQLFPEIAAALAILYAYRKFRAHPLPTFPPLLGGVLATVASVFLKVRYAPVALMLWAYLLFRQARERRWVWNWFLFFMLLLIGFPLLDWLVFDGYLMLRRFGMPIDWLHLLRPNRFHLIGTLGLLIDQKAGLLMYSPVYLLAFLGLALQIKDRKRDGVAICLVWVVYLYILIAHTQDRWHGEFSPSPRYLVVVLPLLSAPLALALLRCRGRLFSFTCAVLSVYSLAMAATLMLVPRWRFRTATGQNTGLYQVGRVLSVDLVDWFPSFIAPTAYTFLVSGIGLAFLGGLVFYFYTLAE